jgi:hypothetical protein
MREPNLRRVVVFRAKNAETMYLLAMVGEENGMKALLLNGKASENPTLEQVRRTLATELSVAGCALEVFELRHMDIAPCQGCFGCWEKTPGECLIDDASKEIARALVRAELLILLTPLTFGGYSSELKKALDRQICFISPFFMKIQGETHHKPRYPRSPRLLGLGVTKTKDPEAEGIFTTLVRRNALNFHSPLHASAVFDASAAQEMIRASIVNLLGELEMLP